MSRRPFIVSKSGYRYELGLVDGYIKLDWGICSTSQAASTDKSPDLVFNGSSFALSVAQLSLDVSDLIDGIYELKAR